MKYNTVYHDLEQFYLLNAVLWTPKPNRMMCSAERTYTHTHILFVLRACLYFSSSMFSRRSDDVCSMPWWCWLCSDEFLFFLFPRASSSLAVGPNDGFTIIHSNIHSDNVPLSLFSSLAPWCPEWLNRDASSLGYSSGNCLICSNSSCNL